MSESAYRGHPGHRRNLVHHSPLLAQRTCAPFQPESNPPSNVHCGFMGYGWSAGAGYGVGSHPMPSGGVFAQRAHSTGTAPSITLFTAGTPLKTTPLQKRASSVQPSIGGAEFRSLGPVATGGGRQPVFRTVRTAHGAPPRSVVGWCLDGVLHVTCAATHSCISFAGSIPAKRERCAAAGERAGTCR